MHAAVYLSLARSQVLLRELELLWGIRQDPFLLLTPTGSSCGVEVESALRRDGAAHLSLALILKPQPGGRFQADRQLAPVLAGWTDRAARASGAEELLRGIRKEIAAVRTDFVQLKGAKENLQELAAGNLFAFVQKVDATSFKVLCAILADGTVAGASRVLQIPDSTLRKVLKQWKHRQGPYAAMLDLVRWRKNMGRKKTVALNQNILLEKASAVDYPGLLADVLDGLLEMNGGNWEEVCERLREMLEPALRA